MRMMSRKMGTVGLWLVVMLLGSHVWGQDQMEQKEPNESNRAYTRVATGHFKVTLTPQEDSGFTTGENLGRATLAKTFSGDLAGEGAGQILTSVSSVKGSAGYVGLEVVQASLHEKRGGFVLQHSSTMDRGQPRQSIRVVPDSGFGELTGIRGEMIIRIENGDHFYTFRYSLEPTN